MPDRERPPRPEPERRLGVLPDRGAGRRVAAVGHGEVAHERRDAPLVEHLADHAQVLVDHQLPPVGDADAGRLLAAVLEREQRGRGDGRGLVAVLGKDDADDPAHQARTSVPGSAASATWSSLPSPSQPSALGSPWSHAWRRSASGTSSASAIRLPRSSAAPGGAVAGELDDEPRAAGRAEGVDREPVLAGEQLERREVARDDLDDEPRRALAEQRDRRRIADADAQRRPDVAPDRHLGERDREAAAGHVLAALDEAARDRLADERLDGGLAGEVERRRAVLGRRAGEPLVRRAGEPGRRVADHDDRVALAAERRADARRDVVQQPDDPDLGRRGDRGAGRLVVQRHVAAGDRQPEGDARVGQAADGLRELPERLRTGGVAEVEAVRDAQRPRAGDRHVAGRLGDGHRGAQPRVVLADRGVAVGRRDERLRRPLDPEDGGAPARARDGVGLDVPVVLLEHLAARRQVGRPEERGEHRTRVLAAERQRVDLLVGGTRGGRGTAAGRGTRLALEHDRLGGEGAGRDPGELLHAGDRAYRRGRARRRRQGP